MNPWRYLQSLLLPALTVGSYFLGGGWSFLVPVICLVIRPMAMALAGIREEQQEHQKDRDHTHLAFHRVILLYVPVLLALNIWALTEASRIPVFSLSWAGLCLSTGFVNGMIGFTLAHEFIHRFRPIDQIAGHLLLLHAMYLHYSIEHVWGHHVYACMPEDPHTARRNESFYAFLPRAIYGTFRNAYHIECRRLARRRRHFWNVHNRLLWFLMMEAMLVFTLVTWGGPVVLVFFLLQSFFAISLMHLVDYLQHYALTRALTEHGKFEQINTHHAWSTQGAHGKVSLFQLENHADHHIHPNRPYEDLHAHADSPVLPGGYALMIWLALIPPLWFHVVNPRIPTIQPLNAPI